MIEIAFQPSYANCLDATWRYIPSRAGLCQFWRKYIKQLRFYLDKITIYS
jgi:hypothetical protein